MASKGRGERGGPPEAAEAEADAAEDASRARADGGGFESPADVFATVNAEGFGVSSNLPKPSHASDLAGDAAPRPRRWRITPVGNARAVRKRWKALTGIGDETDAVAIDGESEADVGAQPSPPQFAEADGGVLKDDVMEDARPGTVSRRGGPRPRR